MELRGTPGLIADFVDGDGAKLTSGIFCVIEIELPSEVDEIGCSRFNLGRDRLRSKVGGKMLENEHTNFTEALQFLSSNSRKMFSCIR